MSDADLLNVAAAAEAKPALAKPEAEASAKEPPAAADKAANEAAAKADTGSASKGAAQPAKKATAKKPSAKKAEKQAKPSGVVRVRLLEAVERLPGHVAGDVITVSRRKAETLGLVIGNCHEV